MNKLNGGNGVVHEERYVTKSVAVHLEGISEVATSSLLGNVVSTQIVWSIACVILFPSFTFFLAQWKHLWSLYYQRYRLPSLPVSTTSII